MKRRKLGPRSSDPVKVRFKPLAHGRKSIYFDIYTGGERHYEFLGLYLLRESDEQTRRQNEATLQEVARRKALRLQSLAQGATMRTLWHTSALTLGEWGESVWRQKQSTGQSPNTLKNLRATLGHLRAFRCPDIALSDIDVAYCSGFIAYLRSLRTRDGLRPYSTFTLREHLSTLNMLLQKAVKEGLILRNPLHLVPLHERVKPAESERAFLTKDEVVRLIHTLHLPPRTPIALSTKRAFLFSCFCGLRYSDLRRLNWSHLHHEDNTLCIRITMQKTRRTLYLPLCDEAQRWMPRQPKRATDAPVFQMASEPYTNALLKVWARDADIRKRISFHVSRHTFATLGLTAGVDIYTVSKLLGHTSIATTQIYARIVDQKKNEAVQMIANLFK